MVKEIHIHHETLLNLQQEVETIQKIVKSLTQEIPTKYAYKGWQGWINWKKLKKVFDSVSHTTRLLDVHFPSIYEIVTGSSPHKHVDIVSLGTGLGDEDVNILKKIANTSHEKFTYYTVDYSKAILERGCYSIANDIDGLLKSGNLKLESIHACCADIEYSVDYKPSLNRGRNKIKKLFHLLGLTLGNNRESSFLKNLTDVLDVEDYLLFDIDCSVDGEEKELKSLIDKYSSHQPISDAFLTNSLLYLVEYHQTGDGFGNFRFLHDVKVEYCDINFCKENSRTDVQDGVTLSRRHVYRGKQRNQIAGRRICDFSNKYSQHGFKQFIEKFCTANGFEIINGNNDIFWDINSSHNKLVLIKKVGVSSTESRSPKEKNNTINPRLPQS